MKENYRVMVDGVISADAQDQLARTCHGEEQLSYIYCGERHQLFSYVNAMRATAPVAAIVSFDMINHIDDLRRLIESTGSVSDLPQIVGLCIIIQSRYADTSRANRYGLTNEGQAFFDYLDKLCRKCGIFIVPWGTFQKFCSPEVQEAMNMRLTLRIFLDDVNGFLTERRTAFSVMTSKPFPQCA